MDRRGRSRRRHGQASRPHSTARPPPHPPRLPDARHLSTATGIGLFKAVWMSCQPTVIHLSHHGHSPPGQDVAAYFRAIREFHGVFLTLFAQPRRRLRFRLGTRHLVLAASGPRPACQPFRRATRAALLPERPETCPTTTSDPSGDRAHHGHHAHHRGPGRADQDARPGPRGGADRHGPLLDVRGLRHGADRAPPGGLRQAARARRPGCRSSARPSSSSRSASSPGWWCASR